MEAVESKLRQNLLGWALTAGALLGLLGHVPALADEWRQSGSVPMTLEYDSNPTLSANNKQSVWRTKILPAYNLIGTYGVDEIKAGLALRIERSSDEAISQNREDPILSLGWRRLTQTGEFGLVANYEQASTRFTELEETGQQLRDGTRTTQSLAGNWRSTISERSTLSADGNYKQVSYDQGGLTNYANLTAGLTYSYAWSERIEPFVRGTASHYEPSGSTLPSSDHTSLMGGVKWKASEYLEWTAQAGASSVSGATSDTGWIGSLAVHYLGPRYDLLLDAGRYVKDSGQGGFIESDDIKGR